ncbi:MAG: Clp protease ClpP [Clostridiales bacterium]
MKVDIKGVIVPNDDKKVYDWLGYDATCPQDITNAISKCNDGKIDVYIDSGGGDVFAGSNIYASLCEISHMVNIHVTGLAASAASVIMCAAKSDIAPTAMVMVHNVSASTNGDYNDMIKKSEVLQKANKSIAAAYIKKTGMSESDALAMMDKETWLTANDAVSCGLVDNILDKNLQFVARIGASLLSQTTINKVRRIINLQDKSPVDFLMLKKEQEILNLLKIGGKKYGF